MQLRLLQLKYCGHLWASKAHIERYFQGQCKTEDNKTITKNNHDLNVIL